MLGGANIERSRSKIATNVWRPQARYPCGNISHTREKRRGWDGREGENRPGQKREKGGSKKKKKKERERASNDKAKCRTSSLSCRQNEGSTGPPHPQPGSVKEKEGGREGGRAEKPAAKYRALSQQSRGIQLAQTTNTLMPLTYCTQTKGRRETRSPQPRKLRTEK